MVGHKFLSVIVFVLPSIFPLFNRRIVTKRYFGFHSKTDCRQKNPKNALEPENSSKTGNEFQRILQKRTTPHSITFAKWNYTKWRRRSFSSTKDHLRTYIQRMRMWWASASSWHKTWDSLHRSRLHQNTRLK